MTEMLGIETGCSMNAVFIAEMAADGWLFVGTTDPGTRLVHWFRRLQSEQAGP